MKLIRLFWILMLALALGWPAAAQQASPAPAPPASTSQEFLRTADQVLAEVSELVKLPLKSPLKKGLRSREEIRAYLLRQLHEDQTPEEARADQIALEKFGLLPKGFALEPFLVELLTEQVAGLYDPRAQEFYVADWIANDGELRMVMAHELVHALQDQHFRLKAWMDAAKPNDDAQLARDAVAEGAATAAMLDYMFKDVGNLSVRTMPDLGPFIRNQLIGGMADSPQMAKAPPFIRDVLLFPYLEGAIFAQRVLKEGAGWEEFNRVFEKPPVSTQQILHPELYFAGVGPEPVELAAAGKVLPGGWRKLEENHLGEFGLHAVLKQFAGSVAADELAPAWAGDSYAVFEQAETKKVLLLFRVRFNSEAGAARFFGAYSDALEKKYPGSADFFRRPNYFAFETAESGVFLHCVAADCLVMEGEDRAALDAVNRALARPPAPAQPNATRKRMAQLHKYAPLAAAVSFGARGESRRAWRSLASAR